MSKVGIYKILIFLFLLGGCEREFDNPYDPNAETDWSPKNVTHETISPYVVQLKWEIPKTNLDYFRIDKKRKDSGWHKNVAGELGNKTIIWKDYNCEKKTKYTYRIYGVAGDNKSSYTSITFTTPEGNPTGTFTDSRDGKTYKWVKIGDQKWMAENLAYIPKVCPPDEDCGIWVNNYIGSSVVEAKQTEEYKKQGCLYNDEKANNTCPEGWHLPSEKEWKRLITNVGGTMYAAKKLSKAGKGPGLKRNNKSGFTAIDAKCMELGKFEDSKVFFQGSSTFSITFRTSSGNLTSFAIDTSGVGFPKVLNDGGYSVRCLKN